MAFHQAKVCAAVWDFSNTISLAFKPSHGNDLSLPFTGCQYPTSDQSFRPNFEQAGSGLAAAQNNKQLSIRTSEPLPLQPHLEEFWFHYLLRRNGCQVTTLREHPLRFVIKSQEIFYIDGTQFYRLAQQIRSMVLEAKRLGDGCKKTVQVPFNNAEKRFTWGEEGSVEEDATLWTRVFEVGPECVADTETIEAVFNLAESRAKRKAHAELYEAWMDPTICVCILCKKMFSDEWRLHEHNEANHRFVELE